MQVFSATVLPLLTAIKSRFTSLSNRRCSFIAIVFVLLSFNNSANAQNAIVAENALAGNPSSEWDINLAGDTTIQGFGTDISVNKGETIHFKIKTTATKYTINIYRIGYYQGNGARKVGTGVITASLPQKQPLPIIDTSTGLIDCGNWTEFAHWDVPATAVSGVYIAKLIRADNGGASHIIFIVRDDASTSDLYFKTSDATWQAYNQYGGNSLYGGNTTYPEGHAAKVSYNRPYITRGGGHGTDLYADFFFNAEYPMVRWMELNGFNVTYTTSLDADRRGSLIKNHKIFLSVGHDEYWSAQERSSVEAARDAGVNLAFFSGDEIYWKTRWEPSIDGSNTSYRTLVCYKEGTSGERACGGKCDPLPNVWTGLWRAGCEYPGTDACKPENSVSGQISWYSSYPAVSIKVPDAYKNLRFWRNTSIPALGIGQTATLTNGTLGFEIDYEQNNGFYPSGRILLSETAVANGITHKMSLYKHSSGALVFGSGTIQWSWGLDGVHDGYTSSVPDVRVQQATVNLFADMGVQPASLQTGLIAATASTDKIAPTSVITAPVSNLSVTAGTIVTIMGTATDVGGVVAGVEVSVDGGVTWQVANGAANWSFSWAPNSTGNVVIKTRSFDDSGNMEAVGNVGSANVVPVTVANYSCPCTVFQSTDVPSFPLSTNNQPLELGFKFRASQSGTINAIRFYKGAGTTGTHSGHLWTSTGTLLGQVTFTTESIAGWQEATFSSPINVDANTTYVASIFSPDGFFAVSDPYFTTPIQRGPLTALANGDDGPNGVYQYAASPAFPTSNYESSNYWVDVVYNTTNLTVSPQVTTQPSSETVCPGTNASFNSTAIGTPTPSVQWQSSLDGVTFTNINGATSPTLTFAAAATDNGKQYRAVWSNGGSAVNSNTVTLTVNSPIVASLSSSTNAHCGNNDGSITISASGGTSPYQFSIDGVSYQNSNVFNSLSTGTYTITIKDAKGCTSTVAGISIASSSTLTASLYKAVGASCKGNDGYITVVGTGGTTPYQYILNGSVIQTTSTFSNLAPGNYSVAVKDANGCTSTISGIILSQDPSLTVSLSAKTNASCIANDGVISVSASGGAAPYLYSVDGVNYQSSATLSGLNAGNYNVTVKDSRGCTSVILGISISRVSTLTVAVASTTKPTCGNSDGSITVNVLGGASPYQYSKDGVSYQTSNKFSNLSPYVYNITVKDSKGCFSNISVALNSQSTLSASLYKTISASCKGNDGSITIVATGGSSPYWYTTDGNNYQTTSSFNNLVPDTFNVAVVDSKYCVAIVPGIIITQDAPLTSVLTSKTDASCIANDGSITITGQGGAGPYLYTKDGVNYQSGNTFTNVAAGTYNITVKDSRSCTSTISGISIAKASTVSLSVSSKTNATCTSNDGSITVTAAGGATPYLYSLNGGTYQSTGMFNNLLAGTYSITAKDAKGCTSTSAVTISSITSGLSASLQSKSNANCGSNDGSITVTATSGIAPYQYSSDGVKFQATNILSNLAAGTYTITVKDAKGCTTMVSNIVISTVSTLAATVSSEVDVTCNGSGKDGSITVQASGGLAPYKYSLNGGSYQTSSTFSNLSKGTYSVAVQDAKGCTKVLSGIAVDINAPLALLAGTTNVSCNGNDGSFTLTVTGGTPPYQYSLLAGNYISKSDFTFSNLFPGTYYVTVRDSKRCTSTVSGIVISKAATLTASALNTNISCSGKKDGTITVTATGGIPPYQYSLDGVNYQSANTFINLSAGTYKPVVKDVMGCTYKVSSRTINNTTVVCRTSSTVAVTTAAATLLAEQQTLQVRVLPNPSANNFTMFIQGDSKRNIQVRVSDAFGRIIYKTEGSINKSYVFGSEFVTGTYFVEITQGSDRKTIKLVKL